MRASGSVLIFKVYCDSGPPLRLGRRVQEAVNSPGRDRSERCASAAFFL